MSCVPPLKGVVNTILKPNIELTPASKFIHYNVGLILFNLFAVLSVKSDVGVSPWSASLIGLSNSFGLTVGSWTIIVCLILVIFNYIFFKEVITWRILVTIIYDGLLFDLFYEIIFSNFVVIGTFTQWSLFIISQFFVNLGIIIYIKSNFGIDPYDATILSLSKLKVFKNKLMYPKIIVEFSFLLLAITVSGPISYGTLALVIIGGYFIRLADRIYYYLYSWRSN